MKLIKFKSFKRGLFVIFGVFLAFFIGGLLFLIEPVKILPLPQTPQSIAFQGHKLLVASDADMVATAYADAKLDRVEGITDTLTVIDLPLNSNSFPNPNISSVKVSNSVMSWPQIMAASIDGTKAYIVEVRSQPEPEIQVLDTIDDMPAGKYLTVVDLSNSQQPKVIESVAVGHNPEHISISPDGKLLAINLEDKGKELLIIKLKSDGKLGQRFYFSFPNEGTRRDNRTAIWHPSGKYLAMTQNINSSIGFYEVTSNSNGDIQITPYGDPVKVGNHLGHPRFTADGHFLLVCDLKWSTRSLPLLNFLANPPGEAISLKFEPESGLAPQIVARAEVGLSPEGFALSPDESLLATVNMRRTYLPNYIPAWRGKPYSSLSLVQFNSQSGQLNTLDEYGFEGLLPEQVTFDKSGKFLAVVIFNYRQPSPKKGAVEFWHVNSEAQPRLARTGFKLDVVRGAHDLILLP